MKAIEQKRCANKNHVGDPLLEANDDNFSVDNKSTDNMSSWCKACQRDRYTSKKKPAEMNFNDYMEDGLGRFVPISKVKEIDKIRDELVRDLVAKADKVHEEMTRLKQNALSEIAAFVELSAADYDVTYGGKKGNLKFHTYDHKLMIQVQISENLSCDERLQIAKKIIDKFLERVSKDGPDDLKTVVNEVFAVNQEGKINIRRILGMRRWDIKDPDWLKAMNLISDSLQVAGSKSYFRLYKRTGPEGKYKNISLDFAAL